MPTITEEKYEDLCDHAEGLIIKAMGPLFLSDAQLPLYHRVHDELYAMACEGAPHIELTTNDTVLLDGKEKDSEALSSQEREWVNRYIKLLISLTGV